MEIFANPNKANSRRRGIRRILRPVSAVRGATAALAADLHVGRGKFILA